MPRPSPCAALERDILVLGPFGARAVPAVQRQVGVHQKTANDWSKSSWKWVKSSVLAWTIRTQTYASSRSRMIGSRRATSSSNSWHASHGMQPQDRTTACPPPWQPGFPRSGCCKSSRSMPGTPSDRSGPSYRDPSPGDARPRGFQGRGRQAWWSCTSWGTLSRGVLGRIVWHVAAPDTLDLEENRRRRVFECP